MLPTYLDCNATTPMEPDVVREVQRFMVEEYGNAASPVHMYGTVARMVVEKARRDVAAVVEADPDEVIFTSGATESNNLSLLGLAEEGRRSGRMHLICSAIEHKAVLEPLQHLESLGFEVTKLPVDRGGSVSVEALADSIRPQTLCVSVMHVNNETGVVQPLNLVAEVLSAHPAWFHVDAAQGFCKELDMLKLKRIDFMSVSAHKVYGPKGIGALIMRKRRSLPNSLSPLFRGGGQEQGLRPGTLPVPLIAGLGMAARLALRDQVKRKASCMAFRENAVEALESLGALIHGDQRRVLPHTINISIPGVEAHQSLNALKNIIAFSNGSACTAHTQEPSHVLQAMGVQGDRLHEAIRLSWCHMTENVDWDRVCDIVKKLQGGAL